MCTNREHTLWFLFVHKTLCAIHAPGTCIARIFPLQTSNVHEKTRETQTYRTRQQCQVRYRTTCHLQWLAGRVTYHTVLMFSRNRTPATNHTIEHTPYRTNIPSRDNGLHPLLTLSAVHPRFFFLGITVVRNNCYSGKRAITQRKSNYEHEESRLLDCYD